MAQVAIAWTLAKPGVTAPIVGTTSLENLKDIIGMRTDHAFMPVCTQRDHRTQVGQA